MACKRLSNKVLYRHHRTVPQFDPTPIRVVALDRLSRNMRDAVVLLDELDRAGDNQTECVLQRKWLTLSLTTSYLCALWIGESEAKCTGNWKTRGDAERCDAEVAPTTLWLPEFMTATPPGQISRVSVGTERRGRGLTVAWARCACVPDVSRPVGGPQKPGAGCPWDAWARCPCDKGLLVRGCINVSGKAGAGCPCDSWARCPCHGTAPETLMHPRRP